MPDNTGSDVTGLQKKINKLQAENMVLKRMLDTAGISYALELKKLEVLSGAEVFDPDQGARIIWPETYTREMAELFHDYFHGRDDVYAKRYVGKKSGIPGYYPQCNLTWKPECPKQKGKDTSCLKCQLKQYKRLHGPEGVLISGFSSRSRLMPHLHVDSGWHFLIKEQSTST